MSETTILQALISEHLDAGSLTNELPHLLSVFRLHDLLCGVSPANAPSKKWHTCVIDLLGHKVPTCRWAGAILLTITLRQCRFSIQTTDKSIAKYFEGLLNLLRPNVEPENTRAAAARATAALVLRLPDLPPDARRGSTGSISRMVLALIANINNSESIVSLDALSALHTFLRVTPATLRPHAGKIDQVCLPLIDAPDPSLRHAAAQCLALLPRCAGDPLEVAAAWSGAMDCFCATIRGALEQVERSRLGQASNGSEEHQKKQRNVLPLPALPTAAVAAQDARSLPLMLNGGTPANGSVSGEGSACAEAPLLRRIDALVACVQCALYVGNILMEWKVDTAATVAAGASDGRKRLQCSPHDGRGMGTRDVGSCGENNGFVLIDIDAACLMRSSLSWSCVDR